VEGGLVSDNIVLASLVNGELLDQIEDDAGLIGPGMEEIFAMIPIREKSSRRIHDNSFRIIDNKPAGKTADLCIS